MRKIQTTNQNQSRVTHLYTKHFLSPRSAARRAPVGACGTRASFGQQQCATCPSVQASTSVELIQLLFPPHHFSPNFNTPLHLDQVLNHPFNTTIHHHCTWSDVLTISKEKEKTTSILFKRSPPIFNMSENYLVVLQCQQNHFLLQTFG